MSNSFSKDLGRVLAEECIRLVVEGTDSKSAYGQAAKHARTKSETAKATPTSDNHLDAYFAHRKAAIAKHSRTDARKDHFKQAADHLSLAKGKTSTNESKSLVGENWQSHSGRKSPGGETESSSHGFLTGATGLKHDSHHTSTGFDNVKRVSHDIHHNEYHHPENRYGHHISTQHTVGDEDNFRWHRSVGAGVVKKSGTGAKSLTAHLKKNPLPGPKKMLHAESVSESDTPKKKSGLGSLLKKSIDKMNTRAKEGRVNEADWQGPSHKTQMMSEPTYMTALGLKSDDTRLWGMNRRTGYWNTLGTCKREDIKDKIKHFKAKGDYTKVVAGNLNYRPKDTK